MITATASGRCSLVGAPTDRDGGSVLACSIRERAHCALDPDAEGITITLSGRRQIVETTADLALRDGDDLNIARAVLTALEITPGQTPPFHLSARTDIPRQAGLAGTAAMLAAITGCLLTHLKLRLNLYQIAELIHKIESDYLGVPCGFQDHYMAVFGYLNFMDFRDKHREFSQEPTTPFATVERLDHYVNGLPFIIAHASGESKERPSGGSVTVNLGQPEVARLARAAKRALLSCDWEAFSAIVNRSHVLQRDLDGGSETSARLIAAALAGGADAAKLAGAGNGGAIVVVTNEPERTSQSLRSAGADTILFPHPAPGLTIAVEVTVP